MSENVYFAAFFFPVLAVIVVSGMKYIAAVLQARAREAHDEAYRELARKMAETQSQMAAAMATHGQQLTDIGDRLGSLEKILKEVE